MYSARVDNSTSPEILWRLVSDMWRMTTLKRQNANVEISDQPKLVLSIAGGAKKFNMKPPLANAFKQGLIEVASNTDALILTGGTATGVTKYVGDAIKEHRVLTGMKQLVAIGIATWGTIGNNAYLEEPGDQGSLSAVCDIGGCAEEFAPLDYNHTSFILVESGTADDTTNIYSTKIALRANLEAHIQKKYTASGGQTTPIVFIVCEGGKGTLQQTRDAINSNIPVVVIKGSGRAADIISEAYRMTEPKHGDEQSSLLDDNRTLMESLINRMFGNPNQNIIKKAVDHLEMILSQRKLITIFDMSYVNCRDLDMAVLSALLKAKKPIPESIFNLAFIWNRADIARNEIFALENIGKWKHFNQNTAMFNALVEGKQEFVQLFIDNGVQLNRFLTIKRLRDLYSTSIKDEDNTMAIIFNALRQKAKQRYDFSFGCCRADDDNSDACLLKDVGKVINLLLDDEYNCMYTTEKFVIPKDEKRRRSSTTKTYDFSPERDLFIWALLFNKVELADLLWKMCTDPIGGALVACSLLRSLAKEATHQEENVISKSLNSNADEFEKMACDVLTSCYERNKDCAHRLLTRELDIWGKRTLFALAESAQLMGFMKHDCCQTKLNAIWFGRMVDNTQDHKIIMALVCPLFIGRIRFKSKQCRTIDSESQEPQNTSNTKGNASPIQRGRHAEEGAVAKHTDSMEAWHRPQSKVSASTANSPVDESFQKFSPFTWLCQKTQRALQALHEFYTSPVTKFYLSMGFYIIYLCLLTFIVLARQAPMTNGEKLTIQGSMELILWVWAFCFFLEEIRQVVRREARSLFFKIVNHLKSFWNLVDLAIFLLFVVVIALRLQPQTDPHINLKDLALFICILVVFILSFGFAIHSLLYPNMKFSYGLLLDAVYTTFSQVFGELSTDKSDDTTQCTTNITEYNNDDSDVQMCPVRTWTVRFLFAMYMMLTNVLLMNILIAMFSYTFNSVQVNSEKVWRFYRYSVVYEYSDAPALPVPFILFVLIYRIYRRFYSLTFYTDTEFKVREKENRCLSTFEETERDIFLAKRTKMTSEQTDNKLKETGDKLQQVLEDIQEIKETSDIKETLAGEVDQRPTSSQGIATNQNHLPNWLPKSYRRSIDRQSSARTDKSADEN